MSRYRGEWWYKWWLDSLSKPMEWKWLSHVQFFVTPMDCSPPGSSVHEKLQARILEWVALLSSRGSSGPRDITHVSCIAGGFFTVWATGKLKNNDKTQDNRDQTTRKRKSKCLCLYFIYTDFLKINEGGIKTFSDKWKIQQNCIKKKKKKS